MKKKHENILNNLWSVRCCEVHWHGQCKIIPQTSVARSRGHEV